MLSVNVVLVQSMVDKTICGEHSKKKTAILNFLSLRKRENIIIRKITVLSRKEQNDITKKTTEAIANIINEVSFSDTLKIEKAKCNYIYQASNYVEAAINYIALEHCGFCFDFGSYTIPKGSVLYRVRTYEKGIDFSNPKEWTPPPHRPLNRANRKGEQALYLNSMEEACLLETHIAEREKYVLGTYMVEEDIVVGGYLYVPSNNHSLLSIGIVLNALLIAPSRGERNGELFDVLDQFFCEVYPDDIQCDDIKNNLSLPFKLAVMNKGSDYYEFTNKLCDILKKQYPDGIKYSSCYLPFETIEIESNCYNVVLYEKGMKKLKFMDYKIKTHTMSGFTSSQLAKSILEQK